MEKKNGCPFVFQEFALSLVRGPSRGAHCHCWSPACVCYWLTGAVNDILQSSYGPVINGLKERWRMDVNTLCMELCQDYTMSGENV
ncbi:unnamed protein product [Pleuronectes platessa]|uniref:Uncharacterized protein n=1 Tax=Pleuronectes platessa TaxID=8262 RepID=A0A9N7VB04_PLEPL|nr:unnamed protein product [Pleuronectes platessa]